jgi:hypothetical protein
MKVNAEIRASVTEGARQGSSLESRDELARAARMTAAFEKPRTLIAQHFA